MTVPEVLFLCVHNAGRSQMAAAFLSNKASGKVVVHSAGSLPADQLNPVVIQAMDEVGITISHEAPKKLLDEMASRADVIVTMGCGDSCPVFAGKRYIDWELADPAGCPIEEVREIRDEISRRVQNLIEELIPEVR